MSFVSHEKLVARLFEELQRPAQDGFSKVTMTQLCLADREFHEKLADKTRAGLAPGPLGELPLDQFVDEVLRLPSFQWVLMQRPAQKASSTLPKGKPPAQQKPKQVVKPQKRRGASKGKAGSKGSRFPMPEKLRAVRTRTVLESMCAATPDASARRTVSCSTADKARRLARPCLPLTKKRRRGFGTRACSCLGCR